MVKITGEYQGDLHCTDLHEPSGSTLVTDAPLDNLGRGEAFSPTDLVATALGTCIATTMGIVAQKHGIDLRGMTVNVTKEMANDPRRIGRLTSEVRIPLPPDHPQRELLEKTGLGCPVHRSLPAEMERPTTFLWEGKAK